MDDASRSRINLTAATNENGGTSSTAKEPRKLSWKSFLSFRAATPPKAIQTTDAPEIGTAGPTGSKWGGPISSISHPELTNRQGLNDNAHKDARERKGFSSNILQELARVQLLTSTGIINAKCHCRPRAISQFANILITQRQSPHANPRNRVWARGSPQNANSARHKRQTPKVLDAQHQCQLSWAKFRGRNPSGSSPQKAHKLAYPLQTRAQFYCSAKARANNDTRARLGGRASIQSAAVERLAIVILYNWGWWFRIYGSKNGSKCFS